MGIIRVRTAGAVCASLLIVSTLPVSAADAPERKFAIGGGYAGSTIELDIERDAESSPTTSGFGLLGRARWSKRWGLQLRYVEGDGQLGTGGELSLDQVAVHPYFVWLESEKRYLRVYAKFGLSWTAFDEETPSGQLFSDDVFGPSIGVGLEWGPPKWAFFFDFGVVFVDLDLAPPSEESVTAGSSMTGFVYRF